MALIVKGVGLEPMLDSPSTAALIGGISTAFFGAIVASCAYLLRQQVVMRDELKGLRSDVDDLRVLGETIGRAGNSLTEPETLNGPKSKEGS